MQKYMGASQIATDFIPTHPPKWKRTHYTPEIAVILQEERETVKTRIKTHPKMQQKGSRKVKRRQTTLHNQHPTQRT